MWSAYVRCASLLTYGSLGELGHDLPQTGSFEALRRFAGK